MSTQRTERIERRDALLDIVQRISDLKSSFLGSKSLGIAYVESVLTEVEELQRLIDDDPV